MSKIKKTQKNNRLRNLFGVLFLLLTLTTATVLLNSNSQNFNINEKAAANTKGGDILNTNVRKPDSSLSNQKSSCDEIVCGQNETCKNGVCVSDSISNQTTTGKGSDTFNNAQDAKTESPLTAKCQPVCGHKQCGASNECGGKCDASSSDCTPQTSCDANGTKYNLDSVVVYDSSKNDYRKCTSSGWSNICDAQSSEKCVISDLSKDFVPKYLEGEYTKEISKKIDEASNKSGGQNNSLSNRIVNLLRSIKDCLGRSDDFTCFYFSNLAKQEAKDTLDSKAAKDKIENTVIFNFKSIFDSLSK